MPKIIFIDHQGHEHSIDANVGETLMEAAVQNNVVGIDG